MKNVMEIEGERAVISYDPDIEMFRGEFIGLNGGADFYADTLKQLQEEGKKSLDVFLSTCRENGLEPRRKFSGRFNLRIRPELHAQVVLAAEADRKSLNEWVETLISERIQTEDRAH